MDWIYCRGIYYSKGRGRMAAGEKMKSEDLGGKG